MRATFPLSSWRKRFWSGSIRTPAAFCGIAGLKPTYGLVSRAGVIPNLFAFYHCGPMTWTVEDCALLLQAIAGYDEHRAVSFWEKPSMFSPFSVPAGPALIVCCGFSASRLSLGLQIAGRPFDKPRETSGSPLIWSIMIPALKQVVAHYASDPDWVTVRPPFIELTPA